MQVRRVVPLRPRGPAREGGQDRGLNSLRPLLFHSTPPSTHRADLPHQVGAMCPRSWVSVTGDWTARRGGWRGGIDAAQPASASLAPLLLSPSSSRFGTRLHPPPLSLSFPPSTRAVSPLFPHFFFLLLSLFFLSLKIFFFFIAWQCMHSPLDGPSSSISENPQVKSPLSPGEGSATRNGGGAQSSGRIVNHTTHPSPMFNKSVTQDGIVLPSQSHNHLPPTHRPVDDRSIPAHKHRYNTYSEIKHFQTNNPALVFVPLNCRG